MSELPLEINVQDTASLLTEKPAPRLIDCREEDEYGICRIKGSQLLPLSQFAETFVDVLGPGARDQRILVHCHHGGRSLRAVQFLRAKGYSQAQSVAGGIEAWSQEIDGSVPRY